MASADFRRLQHRVARLERQFLPAPKPVYTDREYDNTRAFLVLTHAEIEHFLERRATAVADRALNRWKTEGKSTEPLLALTAYYKRKDTPLRDTLSTRVHRAVADHKDVVGGNNGVKEDNVLKLLLPVGVSLTDLDNLWLANMDTFGADRGAVAHTSARAAQAPPDPVTARNLLADVVIGIENVDHLTRGFLK